MLFTFSTGQSGSGGINATDCRMDVWNASDLTLVFSKGERNIQTRSCRLPSFHTQDADSDGAKFIILLLTEYYNGSAGKGGFLRSKLDSDYNSVYTASVDKDEEIVFTGYDFVFRAAFYPSSNLAYATAVD